MVHYRTGNVGLQAQWLEAWWPSSDNEFSFVVEDDLEVSPLYYKFLKDLIVNYYYNASNYSPLMYGASLQRPRFVPGKHGNKMQLDGGTRLFLYQLVGTWGQLLFPRPWKEFRLWYDTHKTKGVKPYLDGMVTTGWYRKLGERIWTPWFIKFVHAHGYFNIYTNFLHERALSVSHRDAGVNYGKTAGPDSYLLNENSLDFNFLEMPPLSNLKWYDFCFREVIPGRVVKDFYELGSVLKSVHKLETIILVSLYGTSQAVIRNLLCHFERLNIRNYIFIGPKAGFLHDLARRGHPVIDADKFFNNIKAQKSIRLQETGLELMKEILVQFYVVKKSLELGYNSWVVGGDMVPFSNVSFLDSYNPSYNFFIGKDIKIFFVRSSSSTRKLWVDEFISNLARMVETLTNKESDSGNGGKFLNVMEKLLAKWGVRMERVDETDFGVNINADTVDETSLQDGKKFAFWSSDLGLDLIQKNLQNLSLWIVDEDYACIAVVCHHSLHLV